MKETPRRYFLRGVNNVGVIEKLVIFDDGEKLGTGFYKGGRKTVNKFPLKEIQDDFDYIPTKELTEDEAKKYLGQFFPK